MDVVMKAIDANDVKNNSAVSTMDMQGHVLTVNHGINENVVLSEVESKYTSRFGV